MHIIRYVCRDDGSPGVGTLAQGRVCPVAGLSGFADLLALDLDEARSRLDSADHEASLPLESVLRLPRPTG